MNSLEIKDKKEELRNKANAIIKTCKSEVREMTEDEKKEYDQCKRQISELNDQLDELEKKLADYEELEQEEEKSKNNRNFNQKSIMEKSFSLIKAIRNVANNVAQDEVSSAVIKEGASQMRKAGINYVGQIQLPMESRGITVGVEHDDVVATDMFDVITPLQKKNVLVQAGAKFVSGLVGDVQYPIMGNGSVSWEGETASAKDGSPAFTNVKLQPKRLTVQVPISKQFLLQDGAGCEAAIREEIINAINSKLEDTILGAAAGSTTQPQGIFNLVAPTVVADFEDICEKEATLESANVYNDCKYIVSPKAKAKLRGMIKGTNGTGMVWENNEVDGTPAYSTSHVADDKYVYGDFSNLIIGSWGNGIDLTVDTLTLAAEGQVRLVANFYVDAKYARSAAFTAGKFTA